MEDIWKKPDVSSPLSINMKSGKLMKGKVRTIQGDKSLVIVLMQEV